MPVLAQLDEVYRAVSRPINELDEPRIGAVVTTAQDWPLRLIFDTAAAAGAGTTAHLTAEAAEMLEVLERAVQEYEEQPSCDPMRRHVCARVIRVGAAFARFLDEDFESERDRRRIAAHVRTVAPSRLDAHPGDPLWHLLSGYRLSQVRHGDPGIRRAGALAMVAMAVEEIDAINDIDPRQALG